MSKHYNSNTRNMAYSNDKQFKAIQQANVLAQQKQDHGRIIGRNNNSELHVGRFTNGGSVMGGLKPSTRTIKKLIANRLN